MQPSFEKVARNDNNRQITRVPAIPGQGLGAVSALLQIR